MSKTKGTKGKLKVAKQSANHQKVIKPLATEEKKDLAQNVNSEHNEAKHKFSFTEFMKSFSFTDKPVASKSPSSKKTKTIKPIEKKEKVVKEENVIEKTDVIENIESNDSSKDFIETTLNEEVKENNKVTKDEKNNDDIIFEETVDITPAIEEDTNDTSDYEVTKDINEYLDKVEEINEDFEDIDADKTIEEITEEATISEKTEVLVDSNNPDDSIYVDFDEDILEDTDDDYEPEETKEKAKGLFSTLKSKIKAAFSKKKETSKTDDDLDEQNDVELLESNNSTIINEEFATEVVETIDNNKNEEVIEQAENNHALEVSLSEKSTLIDAINTDETPVVTEEVKAEEKTVLEEANNEEKETSDKQDSKSGLSKIMSSLNIEVSKPKLGSYKLIFDVTNIDDLIYLELECLDIDFTGFKVKSIDTIYSKTINLNSKSYETDIYLMISEIKEILKKMDINKSVNVLNYCSNLMFFENITLPKLSSSEALKSVKMNLVKLYPEFKKRYVYDILKSPVDNHSNLYTIAMVDIEKYRKVIDWFKELKLNLNYVSLSSDSIRRLLVKNALLPRRHSALIINMKENHTEILSYDGRKVEGMRVAKEGYKKFASEVSAQNRRRYEFILNELKEGSMLEKFIVKRDRRNFVRKALPEVTLECKRIIGEVLLHHNIDNVYLNIEGIDSTLIADCLSRYLKCKVSPFNTKDQKIINHLSSYGASIKTKGTLDFEYPVKLKN